MMLRRHVGILLWLPGNPEITRKRYGWDNASHGRRSPSKWSSVIKTIHSHLCVNTKQKHIFCLISGTSYLTSWDLMLYSRCWQLLEKDEPALSLFVLGLEKTTVSELVFNGSFSGKVLSLEMWCLC